MATDRGCPFTTINALHNKQLVVDKDEKLLRTPLNNRRNITVARQQENTTLGSSDKTSQANQEASWI